MRRWLRHQATFLWTFWKTNWHIVIGLCLGLALALCDDLLLGWMVALP